MFYARIKQSTYLDVLHNIDIKVFLPSWTVSWTFFLGGLDVFIL